ncbi:MAG: hypothetical protein GF308_00515 [Candidatus Heimdallarchaeota archaeon]|nr:hypothetical protein [Candidatus Heimdallarchaeota archaeon]
MIKSPTDLLLLLLYADNQKEIVGSTKLTKLLFLLLNEKPFTVFQEDFDFEPHNYGPWSAKVFDYCELLASHDLIEKKGKPKIIPSEDYDQSQMSVDNNSMEEENQITHYSLKEKGAEVSKVLYERLSEKEKSTIEDLKNKYNKMSLEALLKLVYRKYKNFITKSIIKEKVLSEKDPETEFREQYPDVKISSDFFKLVGILPPMTLEEEEEELREIITEKF